MGAYDKWHLEDFETPRFTSESLEPYNGRRATHIRKLSMVFSACRSDSMIIEKQDLDRSILLLEETEKHMPSVFDGSGKLSYAETLQRILKKLAIQKTLTYSEILREHARDIEEEQLQKIIKVLIKIRACLMTKTLDGEMKLHYIPEDMRSKIAEDQPKPGQKLTLEDVLPDDKL